MCVCMQYSNNNILFFCICMFVRLFSICVYNVYLYLVCINFYVYIIVPRH